MQKNTLSFIVYLKEYRYIPKDVLNKIKDKSITHNIFRIQSDDSIISLFYCIAPIQLRLQEKFCSIIQIYFLLITSISMKIRQKKI